MSSKKSKRFKKLTVIKVSNAKKLKRRKKQKKLKGGNLFYGVGADLLETAGKGVIKGTMLNSGLENPNAKSDPMETINTDPLSTLMILNNMERQNRAYRFQPRRYRR